jgi:hypothetical protein
VVKMETFPDSLGSSTNFTIDGMTAKNPTSAGATTSRSGALSLFLLKRYVNLKLPPTNMMSPWEEVVAER